MSKFQSCHVEMKYSATIFLFFDSYFSQIYLVFFVYFSDFLSWILNLQRPQQLENIFLEMSEPIWNWQAKVERLRKLLEENALNCTFDVTQSSVASGLPTNRTADNINEV